MDYDIECTENVSEYTEKTDDINNELLEYQSAYERSLQEQKYDMANYYKSKIENLQRQIESAEGNYNPTETAVVKEITTDKEILEDGVNLEHFGTQNEIPEETETVENIIGNPEKDAENWHLQTEQNSCAIACQSFIAEQLLDGEYPEEEMIKLANKQGWYDSAEGTSPVNVGRILEKVGLDVERSYDVSFSELAEALENDEKIICGVNNAILAQPEMAQIPGLRANHAVQVIGIDYSNPNNVEVILNDPGVENGQGIRHNLETFMAAWKTGGNFAAFASKGE